MMLAFISSFFTKLMFYDTRLIGTEIFMEMCFINVTYYPFTCYLTHSWPISPFTIFFTLLNIKVHLPVFSSSMHNVVKFGIIQKIKRDGYLWNAWILVMTFLNWIPTGVPHLHRMHIFFQWPTLNGRDGYLRNAWIMMMTFLNWVHTRVPQLHRMHIFSMASLGSISGPWRSYIDHFGNHSDAMKVYVSFYRV